MGDENHLYTVETQISRLALKIVVMTRELLTGKRLRRERQPKGFGQLYFSLLMSVFFPFTYLLRELNYLIFHYSLYFV